MGNLLFSSGIFEGTSARQPNVFTFDSAADTRYLAIEILSTTGTTLPAVHEVVFSQNLAVAAVPEPGTWALLAAGLGAVGFKARRRRSA